ncbi:ferredoxin family protein [Deinococcus cavernae]|uniref:Ferredoxin n=1 Tax=Deinococcus cavernae TaxID=2320857 RepID=A0A418V7R9_9DEIO|nr:ferredoxin [Deinococcus cavernae]RJF72121.1 ferredoxin family protein [Deinococcus cavernae]
MPHVITSPCIGTKDQACTEVCPVECIYDAGEMFLIHPDECIDCGACVPACPVSAIYPEEDVPAEESAYIEKNRAHFGL